MATPIALASLPNLADVSKEYEDMPALVHYRRVEPVGFWFENRFDPETNGAASPVKAKVGNFPGSDSTADKKKSSSGPKSGLKGGTKMSEEDLETDWYEVLELEEGEDSTEDMIRTAYRKRCLDTHPDKQPDHSDTLFKQVQRGFDILGNEESRRAFDSSRPFDDDIPGDNVSAEKFYTAFTEVFERNKRWSLDSAPPSLGDEKTPIEEVNKFYGYWMAFKSWRDFSSTVELEKIDEGMSREEKRYYMKGNQSLLEKAKRGESKRIRNLVERAQNADPRIKAHNAAEEAKREAELAARQEARDAKIHEERKRKQAESDAKKAAEVQKQVAADDSKVVIKQSIKDIRAYFEDAGLLCTVKTNKFFADKVRLPNIFWLFQKADSAKAKEITEAILGKSTTQLVEVPAGTSYIDNGEAGEGIEAVINFNQVVESREGETGVTRFGEGCKKRDVTAIAPLTPVSPAATGAKKFPTWSEDDLLVLQKAIAKYPGGTTERWSKIVTELREKFTEEQVLAKTKEMEQLWKTDKSVMKQKDPSLPAATHADPAVDPEKWSGKQQRALEAGIREHKDAADEKRWLKIAEKVEGKTAKQCFERFKHLSAMRKTNQDAKVCCLKITFSFFKTNHQLMCIMIEKYLNFQLIEPSCIVSWIFSPYMLPHFDRLYLWQMLDTTIKFCIKRCDRIKVELEKSKVKLNDKKEQEAGAPDPDIAEKRKQLVQAAEEEVDHYVKLLEDAERSQKEVFLIVVQRFIMILTDHIVRSEQESRYTQTLWFRCTRDRLRQTLVKYRREVKRYMVTLQTLLFTPEIEPKILECFTQFKGYIA